MAARSPLRPVFPFVILVAVMILSLFWGRYPDPGFTGISRLVSDPLARNLIWNLRLPRILLAVLLGSSLAVSGGVLQTVLGNPLVEPGLLGVSQGSAFGAALAILLAGRFWSVSLSATVFGLAGLGLTWFFARHIRYGGSILRLVLAGVAVSALFSAGLGLLKTLADARNVLPELTFWMMGGLGSAGWPLVYRTAPPVLLSLTVLLLVRWRINLLALDDRSAFALGSHPGRDRTILVVMAVVGVASVTAAAGIVSWVGLLIPHIARKLAGADTRRYLPLSAALGSIFVLICDDAARGLLAGEIPLGLLTAFSGSLIFMILMSRPLRKPALQ